MRLSKESTIISRRLRIIDKPISEPEKPTYKLSKSKISFYNCGLKSLFDHILQYLGAYKIIRRHKQAMVTRLFQPFMAIFKNTMQELIRRHKQECKKGIPIIYGHFPAYHAGTHYQFHKNSTFLLMHLLFNFFNNIKLISILRVQPPCNNFIHNKKRTWSLAADNRARSKDRLFNLRGTLC